MPRWKELQIRPKLICSSMQSVVPVQSTTPEIYCTTFRRAYNVMFSIRRCHARVVDQRIVWFLFDHNLLVESDRCLVRRRPGVLPRIATVLRDPAVRIAGLAAARWAAVLCCHRRRADVSQRASCFHSNNGDHTSFRSGVDNVIPLQNTSGSNRSHTAGSNADGSSARYSIRRLCPACNTLGRCTSHSKCLWLAVAAHPPTVVSGRFHTPSAAQRTNTNAKQ